MIDQANPETVTRYELIEESRRECEKHRQALRRQIGKYTSSAYKGSKVSTKDDPENYYFAYIANASARNLVWEPMAHLATDVEEASPRVLELEAGLNNWYVDTRYVVLRERFLVDFSLGYAVASICQEPRAGFEEYGEDAIQTPRMYRVPPGLFGWDTVASHFTECAFLFHTCVKRKKELLKLAETQDGWDKEAINAIDDQGVNEVRQKQGLRRGEVVYFEYWDRHHKLPDDDPAWSDIPEKRRKLYHGTLFTIALAGGMGKEHAKDLRKPRPCFCPEHGPYVLGGFLTVPDEVIPLSALTANEPQFIALNNQARRNDRAARLSKTVTIVDAMMPDAKAAVLDATDGDVLGVPGFDPTKVQTIQIGGLTADDNAREVWLRQRADRGVGTSDYAKGQASGEATLGENLLAAGAIAQHTALFDAKFAQFQAECALDVLWLLHNDERSATRANGNVFISGGSDADLQRAQSQGFVPEDADMEQIEDVKFSFEDLNVRVESLRVDGTEEQRLVEVGNMLLQWTPLLMQGASQFVNLDPYMKRAAVVYRFPELGRIFDLEAAAEFAQEQMEMANQAPAKEPRSVPGPERPVGVSAAQKNAKSTQPKGPKVTNGE